MKFQGLVLLTLLSLSSGLRAQTNSGFGNQGMVPSELPNGEMNSVPSIVPPHEAMMNIDAELQHLRAEIRQFQKLNEEVSRSIQSTDTENERMSVQQRQELLDLMTKLAKTRNSRKARPTPPQPTTMAPKAIEIPEFEPLQPESSRQQPEPPESSPTGDPVMSVDELNALDSNNIADAFSLGKVLFNKGEFASAEKAFRKAKVAPENEMTLKYLIATCLRRQSKWRSALGVYKIVAESDQDPVLQKLAQWQLDTMRRNQESELQLDQLRRQREKRLESKKNASKESEGSTK